MTASGVLILSDQERRQLKNRSDFKRYNRLWNESKMGYVKRVGQRMELIAHYEPETFTEWKQIYLKYGRSWETMQEQAAEWAAISGLPPHEALAHHIIHCIDEPWEGYQRENSILEWLQENIDHNTFRTPSRFDPWYGIDLGIKDGDHPHGFKRCFQVKAESFFRGDRLQWQRDKTALLHQRAEAEGLEPFFLNASDILKRNEFIPIHWSDVSNAIGQVS